MTTQEIMAELERFGDPQTKKTHMKYGAKEPFFGVKIEHLKKILKKTKKNHALSLELYDTGNSDAMYLAGLMADEQKITKEQVNKWIHQAYWSYLYEYTVPWVAAETAFGMEIGLEWITHSNTKIVCAGWSTLSSVVLVQNDKSLDLTTINHLLEVIEQTIGHVDGTIALKMNGFIIAVGTAVAPLSEKALKLAEKIGKLTVQINGSSCKVPYAPDYIKKTIDKGTLGKKRKTARC